MAVATTTEIRQGYRRHGDSVRGAWQQREETETTVKKLEVFTDSDWACDQVTKRSTSGPVIMAEGMRLHAHSRGQAAVALSSCEAEVVAVAERHQRGDVVARGVDVRRPGILRHRGQDGQ